jgi:hypothetical protein
MCLSRATAHRLSAPRAARAAPRPSPPALLPRRTLNAEAVHGCDVQLQPGDDVALYQEVNADGKGRALLDDDFLTRGSCALLGRLERDADVLVVVVLQHNVQQRHLGVAAQLFRMLHRLGAQQRRLVAVQRLICRVGLHNVRHVPQPARRVRPRRRVSVARDARQVWRRPVCRPWRPRRLLGSGPRALARHRDRRGDLSVRHACGGVPACARPEAGVPCV